MGQAGIDYASHRFAASASGFHEDAVGRRAGGSDGGGSETAKRLQLVPIKTLLLLCTAALYYQTSLFASLADGIPSGSYLSDCAVVKHALEGKFSDVDEKLWAASREDVGLPPWPASG